MSNSALGVRHYMYGVLGLTYSEIRLRYSHFFNNVYYVPLLGDYVPPCIIHQNFQKNE
jgi:hypothetical protein